MLSVVAVVWQVLSWRLTGAVVKVDTRRGFLVTGTGAAGADIISVVVRNVGRSPVEVGRCGLKMPDGSTMIVPNALDWQGPKYPHTLDGGHSATWYFDLDEVRLDLRKNGLKSAEVRGVAGLGVESKNTLSVTAT